MATTVSENLVQELYIAYFGRAADPAGLAFYADNLDSNTTTVEEIATTFAASDEAQEVVALSTDAFLDAVYLQSFSRARDVSETFWAEQIDAGNISKELAMVEILKGAQNEDVAAVENKVMVATAYTAAVVAGDKDPSGVEAGLAVKGVLSAVTADALSVEAGKAAAQVAVDVLSVTDAVVEPPVVDTGVEGNTSYLTVDQDILTGTADNDTFIARGNNSLNNADIIDGGAGTDTVEVMVDNQETAETPLFTNIEILKVQGQDENPNTGDNQTIGNADIDAGDMIGVREFWSEDSRSDVVIEGIERNSNETTINWTKSDSGDVDYTALFYHPTDAGQVQDGATLTLDLVNVQALTDGGNPLDDNQYFGFKFTLNDIEYIIESADFAAQVSYEGLKNTINTLLSEQPALSGLTATLGNISNVFNSDTSALVGQKTAIVITNAVAGVLAFNNADAWITDSGAPAVDNVAAKISNEAPITLGTLTQVDVVLDYVGHGSPSGDLLIGNMSDGTTHEGSDGIQQFNVEVNRDSSLASMSSTANGLEVVNLENVGANGDVTIANLTDVQTLNAATMIGSVNVDAFLTRAVAGKYMDLQDTAANVATDNIAFNYALGTASDSLNLVISADNFDVFGTTTREDFDLNITGNAGDDSITTSIVNDFTAAGYENSVSNANLSIDAGTGNDTVTTSGQGNFHIMTGTGNDTVYADNTGDMSKWAVNAVAPVNNDLDGNGAGASAILDGAILTVTYSGPTALGVTAGDAVSRNNGFESSAVIPTTVSVGSQAQANQAIKTAINGNDVLNKLLVANDGPENTLVITSLIDGTNVSTDIAITVQAVTLANVSVSQQAVLKDAYINLLNDSNAVLTQSVLDAAAAAVQASSAPALVISGTEAANIGSDNTINLGSGNDVAVLGTDNDSNDTIVFSGANIGNNTIVNYDETAALGVDALDFSAYLLNEVTSSGSLVSQVSAVSTIHVANTAVNSLSADANDVIILNNFVSNATETFSNMTGANVLSAIQDNLDTYGNLGDTDLDVNNTQDSGDTLVGTSMANILMVENGANDGQYNVFQLTSSATTLEFTNASLLGQVDFGDTLDGSVAGPVVIVPPANVDVAITADTVGVDGVVENFTYAIDSSTGDVTSQLNGDFTLTDFTVGEDSLSFVDVATGNVTTADLISNITVSGSAISNITDIIFDANSAGDAFQLTLVGIVDETLATVDMSVIG